MPNYGFKKTGTISKSKKTSKNYRGMRKYKRSRTLATYYPKIMPNSFNSCLNYQEEVNLDAPSGGSLSALYRANGMYDPSVAVGGHQPYGLDQLTAFYKYWRVEESIMTATPIEAVVTDSIPCYAAIVLTDTDTAFTFTDVGQFLEFCNKMGSKVVTIGSFTAQNSAINQPLTLKWSYKKWLKANPNQEWNWGIGSTTDPQAGVCFFRLITYSVNGNNPGNHAFRVSINYKAKFFTPIVLPES